WGSSQETVVISSISSSARSELLMQSPTSAAGTSAHATSAEPARTAVKVRPAPRRKEILKESSKIVKICTPTLLGGQVQAQKNLRSNEERHAGTNRQRRR